MSNLHDITIFGETNFRNQQKSFGIKRDDRRRHMYVIGKTGMGKTTLLENLIISDILKGEGCCYIDPHGDTAQKILDYIPPHRINDVIYFNPADTDFPIAFNVLEAVDEKHKHLIASGLISVFKKLWADSWGPRLEYILRNSLLALLDYEGSTLLGTMRILVDKEYRGKVVAHIKDPVVRSFWVNEFTQWNDRVLQEVISPIQNKVGQFLSNFLIRNIIGQVKSTIDLREIMDQKKILILNLSKGRIGEDTMQLIGSMVVTKLYLAAMSRVDIPEAERADFYLYVDEFQNFATESFADILSEARKYRLNLIVAHQYVEQLHEKVSAAIFGNVGTLICFRIGMTDAQTLVNEFMPFFIEEDLVNLPAFSIYLKLMIDGVTSDPFSASTLPPLFEDFLTNNADKVLRISRERYANSREVVEDKINRWSGSDFSEKMVDATRDRPAGDNRNTVYVPRPAGAVREDRRNDAPRPPRRDDGPRRDDRPRPDNRRDDRVDTRPNSQPLSAGPKPISTTPDSRPAEAKPRPVDNKPAGFPAVCSRCGKDTTVPFKPTGDRPVYCQDCLKLIRAEREQVKPEPAKTLRDAIQPWSDDDVTITKSDQSKS